MFLDMQSFVLFKVFANPLDKSRTYQDKDEADDEPGQRYIGEDIIGRSRHWKQVAIECVAQYQDGRHRYDPLPAPEPTSNKETNRTHIRQDIGDQDQEDPDGSQVAKEHRPIDAWSTAPAEHERKGNYHHDGH